MNDIAGVVVFWVANIDRFLKPGGNLRQNSKILAISPKVFNISILNPPQALKSTTTADKDWRAGLAPMTFQRR